MHISNASVAALLTVLLLGTAPLKAQAPDPFEPYSAPELAWSETDGAPSFVARVRAGRRQERDRGVATGARISVRTGGEI